VPAPNLAVPHAEFIGRSNRHAEVLRGSAQIEARLQKLVAELVMLRLFDEFQEALAGVAFRLACGTPYVDGTAPTLLTAPASTTASARQLYATFGRSKRATLRWSKTSFICDATKYVLDPSNAFISVCNANALGISEMRAIRNRIAHSNAGSRAAFAEVVQRRYGATLNHVSPGMLLISTRFSPTLLDGYLGACRTIMNGCAKA
jgi:hypothetical protein